jgi:hypothetical protein
VKFLFCDTIPAAIQIFFPLFAMAVQLYNVALTGGGAGEMS